MASESRENKLASKSFIRSNTPKKQDSKRSKLGEITHVLTGEAFSDYEDVGLVKVVDPLYTSMKIFGLHWQSKKNLIRGKFFALDWKTAHCLLLLLSAWFNALRYFAFYDENDKYGSLLFRKICIHLYSLQFACGITSNVYFKCKYISHFVLLWENYKLKHGGVLLSKLRRNVVIRLVCINVSLTVVYAVSYVYFTCTKPDIFAEFHFPILNRIEIELPIWAVILGLIWLLYITMAWLQALIFCLCINKNLLEEFKELSAEFSEDIHQLNRVSTRLRKQQLNNVPNHSVPRNDNAIEHYRQRYLELCKLVSLYDDVISSYLLCIYAFSVPSIILLVYALFGFDDGIVYSSLHFYMSFSSLIFYVIVVISVTASASSINTAVSMKLDLDLLLCKQTFSDLS